MAMPMPQMPPMPQANPFEKFGGGADPMMGGMSPSPMGGMPAPAPMPMPMPTPTKRPQLSKPTPQPAQVQADPTPQEQVDVAESYDQMIADMINEYRGLFQWQSQWRRY